jgi:hypothetical protein
MRGADLSHVEAMDIAFIGSSFRNAGFAGAQLIRTSMHASNFMGADFYQVLSREGDGPLAERQADTERSPPRPKHRAPRLLRNRHGRRRCSLSSLI